MADPQPGINAPQARAAIFLVLTVTPGTAHVERTRQVCGDLDGLCLLYTSPSPRDRQKSRMPSSA